MKIIRPITITEAMVVGSNAVEAHPTWVSTTTYALGAKVISGSSIYESIQASNTNKDPALELTWWLRIGPTNKMAMFDGQLVNKTEATNELTVFIAPGTIVQALAFFGLTGYAISVKMRIGSTTGTVVWEATQNLFGDESTSWFQYFFDDPFFANSLKTQVVFRGNIPPAADAVFEVKITGTGTVSIGEAILGREYELGQTQYGLQAGITDFSRKETDEFGNTTFVKRPFSKRLDAEVWVRKLSIGRAHRILEDIRATPVVWLATDAPEYGEPSIVYGFYRDFSTQITYPTYSVLSLEIEGLI
jgi:hypothetical protein